MKINELVACNVKKVACCDKPTEGDYCSAVPLSSTESFTIYQFIVSFSATLLF